MTYKDIPVKRLKVGQFIVIKCKVESELVFKILMYSILIHYWKTYGMSFTSTKINNGFLITRVC